MNQEIKVAMIGLDTSHTVEFTRRMAGTALRATTCLAFVTPFQNEDGIKARRQQMEDLGAKVTDDFNLAVADCDAIMIEINDPSLHLEYFKRCAELGKPIFLDKPLADNCRNGKQIAAVAAGKNVKFFSCSPLRYDVALAEATAKMATPQAASVWGPLGLAPAGSSIVWYGVHAFEMLQRAMGCGAAAVQVINDYNGVVAHVDYADGRRGLVELTVNAYRYGGVLRDHQNPEVHFAVAPGAGFYDELIKQVDAFFRTGVVPVSMDETLEVMGMLDAAERSSRSGRNEAVYRY